MSAEQDAWVARALGFSPPRAANVANQAEPDEGEDVDVEAEGARMEELGISRTDLWDTAIDGFRSATEKVDGQITALQAALRETDDAELHEIADSGLNAVTGNTRVPLLVAIREAGSGQASELAAAKPKLLKAIANLRSQLSSEAVKACDNNPFEVPVSIEDTYSAALDRLVYALKLAA